jgi:hypothetical protein
MARAVESVYQDIGQSMNDALASKKWIKAWIRTTFDGNTAQFNCQFLDKSGASPDSFAEEIEPQATDLLSLFTELRKTFDIQAKQAKKQVGAITFTMEKGGEFKIELAYRE